MSSRGATRRGFSLIELLVATAAASALTAGLMSTLFIAMQASNTSNTPAAGMMRGTARLSELSAELHYAQTISEQTATAITVTVPDRTDADASPETIRFAWSGIPGTPLTRQYNAGTAATLAADVHDFGIVYYQPALKVEYLTVWIQITSDPRTRVETAIPLLNQP